MGGIRPGARKTVKAGVQKVRQQDFECVGLMGRTIS